MFIQSNSLRSCASYSFISIHSLLLISVRLLLFSCSPKAQEALIIGVLPLLRRLPTLASQLLYSSLFSVWVSSEWVSEPSEGEDRQKERQRRTTRPLVPHSHPYVDRLVSYCGGLATYSSCLLTRLGRSEAASVSRSVGGRSAAALTRQPLKCTCTTRRSCHA